MREFATNDTRHDETRGAPRQLLDWLKARGLTLEAWRQECRAKQDLGTAALALQRRRLALAARQ